MNDKQLASAAIAEMLDQAKELLKAAKKMGDESGIVVSYEDFYSEVADNWYVDWNGSFC